MEKKLFIFLVSLLALVTACNQTGEGDHSTASTALAADTVTTPPDGDDYSMFIPKDSANKMISSYLASINYPANDSDLYSLIIDAKKLQDYINQATTAGLKATKIKLMFAHTLDYINSGGKDQNCGYKSGKLTLVLAAYDSAGNYIYMQGSKVMDRMQPCPNFCPSVGSASSNTLQ